MRLRPFCGGRLPIYAGASGQVRGVHELSQGRVYSCGGFFLHSRHNMAVKIQSDADLGMAEPL
jgi:hypothetical protein